MQDNNSPDTTAATAATAATEAAAATAAATEAATEAAAATETAVATTTASTTLDDPDTLDHDDNELFNVRRRGRSVPNTNPENRPHLSEIFRAPPAPELPQDDFLLGRDDTSSTSSTRASSSPTPVQSPRGQGRG